MGIPSYYNNHFVLIESAVGMIAKQSYIDEGPCVRHLLER